MDPNVVTTVTDDQPVETITPAAQPTHAEIIDQVGFFPPRQDSPRFEEAPDVARDQDPPAAPQPSDTDRYRQQAEAAQRQLHQYQQAITQAASQAQAQRQQQDFDQQVQTQRQQAHSYANQLDEETATRYLQQYYDNESQYRGQLVASQYQQQMQAMQQALHQAAVPGYIHQQVASQYGLTADETQELLADPNVQANPDYANSLARYMVRSRDQAKTLRDEIEQVRRTTQYNARVASGVEVTGGGATGSSGSPQGTDPVSIYRNTPFQRRSS